MRIQLRYPLRDVGAAILNIRAAGADRDSNQTKGRWQAAIGPPQREAVAKAGLSQPAVPVTIPPMQSETFSVRTRSREEIVIITAEVDQAIRSLGARSGLCTVFTPHTTAAITVNENADPDVPSDLVRALRKMVPEVRFDHAEGNSDAHLLSAIIGPSVTLPIVEGRLGLGRWQGVFFVELDGPRTRNVEVHVVS